MNRINRANSIALLAVAVIFASCGKERSSVTGWNYNDEKNGGFEVTPYFEQETGPGLVFIEGGTFSMGRTEQNVLYSNDNIPRRVTVSSFYIDETEVANVHYREYLHWTTRVFTSADMPEVYRKALPDTLVWREKLAYNEPYVEYYLRHPAYNFYPVVGVNWLQANDFCAWRTDRVNEWILVREGILRMNPLDAVGENYFNTDAYLVGQYEGDPKGYLYDYNPASSGERKVRMEDGILLPRYRLPTEAEWEFAALAYIGNTVHERVTERRLYPWNGSILRTGDETYKGTMMANYVRGRGDYMGIAGKLNDAADITDNVFGFWPNDYGLYCMAGNVSEWVMDVYRPLTFEDMDEFRPVRGNVFKTKVLDQDGFVAEKHAEEPVFDEDSNIVQLPGRLKWREVTVEENVARRNYRKSDNINFQDGNFEVDNVKYDTYNYPKEIGDLKSPEKGEPASMVDDRARVYKGGSWRDRAYWLSPGTRRFLDERQSTATIGFRCAMARVGATVSYAKK